MKHIIRVENLSKHYQIGVREAAYGTLREALSGAVRAPLRRLRGTGRETTKTLWALKEINFEVAPGEVIGLIGRNGAGKSTLLKILSRITEPTSGRIELYGRIGSLLEVGTGFHPELTGRENIYLSGAILGMSRAEISRKFDEVVAFSEIEEFLETPVKRYSSGMYVRLAFSVAAHMEPQILLVDEVLAVGDLAFQKKCLEHMKRLKRSGMTILLVSHNMAAIQSTCERSIFLYDGKIAAFDSSVEVVKQYRDKLREQEQELAALAEDAAQEADSSGVTLKGFEMFGAEDAGESSRRNFRFGEEVRIRIHIHAARRVEAPLINFGLRRGDGVIVCNFNNWFDNFKIDYIEGDCFLEGWLPPLRLIPHYYEIHVLAWQRFSGRAQSDLSRLRPLAYTVFGDFSIEGPPLTDQDGVFQQPAKKWVLTRGGQRIEYTGMDAESLAAAFDEQPQLTP
ncbi:MAG TPA: ABC transporter ATP-binding protein [Pyrinomonadaceae bacterium]|jgi:lipopolysaccharide transport system ATP-binding protein